MIDDQSATAAIQPPENSELPYGFAVRLSRHVQVHDGGRTLVGGTGGRVLRLRGDLSLGAGEVLIVESATNALLARILLDRGMADPVWLDHPDQDQVDPGQISQDQAGPEQADDQVTVVIAVRDRPKQLDRLLRSLGTLPVIIVDDASHAGQDIAAIAKTHGAQLIRHPANLGPAMARNTGARAARTEFVAFIDSDVIPTPGWLAILRRHLNDPALAMVAPRIRGMPQLAADGWLARYEYASSALDLGPDPAAVAPGSLVSYVPSATLLVRRAALGTGFTESMRCGEDVDLVWRQIAAGWRVRYEPAAVVRHDHRVRLLGWLARKAFYGTSAAPLAERHGDAVSPLRSPTWVCALAVCALAQRRWSLPVAAIVLAATTRSIAARLPPIDHRYCLAGTLVAKATAASGRQFASAVLRHYWPLSLLGAIVSRRFRRALLIAVAVDTVSGYRRTRPQLGLPAFAVARRLDDLAYGAGLWWGSLRARHARALRPIWRR